MPTEDEARTDEDRRGIGLGVKRTALSRLGSRLRRARRRSGLNQSDVAEAVETSTQTVRNWEAGRHEPPPSAIRKLAKLYEVNEDTFVSDLDPAIATSRTTGYGFPYDRVTVDPGKLVEARGEAGLSQAMVAELTGFSLSAIRRYESGENRPATKTLQAMASIYDRPAGWFTHRGYFTEEESALFARSVITSPGTGSHDALVLKTFKKAKPDLSDEDKLNIANYILFVHDRSLSGRGDDLTVISIHNDQRGINERRIRPSDVVPP